MFIVEKITLIFRGTVFTSILSKKRCRYNTKKKRISYLEANRIAKEKYLKPNIASYATITSRNINLHNANKPSNIRSDNQRKAAASQQLQCSATTSPTATESNNNFYNSNWPHKNCSSRHCKNHRSSSLQIHSDKIQNSLK